MYDDLVATKKYKLIWRFQKNIDVSNIYNKHLAKLITFSKKKKHENLFENY